MIQQKSSWSRSIRRQVLLGLVFAILTMAVHAQILPLPLNTTVFLPAKNISNTSGISYGQQVAVDFNGNVSIAWLDNTPGYYAVFFRHSSDGGLTFSALQNLSNDPGGSSSPQTAVESAGNINVVWAAMSGNQSGFLSRSTDGGATFSAPVNISSNMARTPTIALDSSGNIYIGWEDASSRSHNIFFSRSNDGGMTFSTPVQLTNRPPAGGAGSPLIAVDSNGNINLVWQDCLSYCSIWFNRSTDGGATFSPQVKLAGVLEFPSPLGMALDSNANTYVVFNTVPFGSVWLVYTTDAGSTFAGTNVSNLKYPHSAGQAQIAVDPSNNVDVVWKDENPSNIFFSRSTDGGATFSATSITNTGTDPQIAANLNGNINLVWTGSLNDIFFSGSADGGATFSTPQNLTNHTSSNPALSPSPLMVLDQCGNANIAWIDDSPGNPDIFFTRGITADSILNGCILRLLDVPSANLNPPDKTLFGHGKF